MRRALFSTFACVIAIVTLVATPATGQEPSGQPEVPLSLAEALRTALENNLDLVLQRMDPLIADQNVIVEEAFFDPVISAGPSASGFKREPTREFESAGRGNTVALSADWADRLQFGGDYSVGFSGSKSTGSDLFYDPAYQSSLTLQFNMPLLRRFGTDVNTQALLVARGNLAISHDELRRQAEESMTSVEGAYWNVVAAREASRVAGQALKLAQDLLSLNRKKVEVGTLAPIEITQAEAGVASREEGVIAAETLVYNTEDELRRLMGIPKDDPRWNQRILPTDQPTFAAKTTDLQASLQKALEARPELASARENVKNAEIVERAAHNGVKPGLDLHVNVAPLYGNNLRGVVLGPAGTCLTNGIPCNADTDCPVGDFCDHPLQADVGGFGTSLDELPKLNNYQWNASLIFSIPIGNHAAKANFAISTLNRERAEANLQNVEQSVRVGVRTSVRNVDSGAKRVAAASSNVTLQQKKLEAEQKKFDNGMSTSFEVLTFQNDLLDAQVRLIQAITDYNKSLAELEQAQGTLLEARGLKLE